MHVFLRKLMRFLRRKIFLGRKIWQVFVGIKSGIFGGIQNNLKIRGSNRV